MASRIICLEDLATEALEYFLDHGELKPLLFWTGTGQFPRETIWEGREEREAWERNNRRMTKLTSNPRLKADAE